MSPGHIPCAALPKRILAATASGAPGWCQATAAYEDVASVIVLLIALSPTLMLIGLSGSLSEPHATALPRGG
jgi:hypothetical protein